MIELFYIYYLTKGRSGWANWILTVNNSGEAAIYNQKSFIVQSAYVDT
jgi:hypothetical protein